ncbi:MAG: NERD domain-containing protein [Treponema sp.]|nr:NERD domain-containing protein [Treponema sp.]
MFITLIATIAIIFLVLTSNSAKIKGSIGELKVNAHLNVIGSEYIFLHDIMIRNSKGTTSQIDHIVLSEQGIFVIETKNYKGWIFGNEKSEYWTQVLFKKKYQFRNPVKQNWSHIYALKTLLTDFPHAKYYPIIVFAGSAILKKIESSVPVIYDTVLNRTIKNYSTEKCLSSEEVLQIKNCLQSAEIYERASRKKHVQNIQYKMTERQVHWRRK